jgi:hypothetical protein
VVLLYKNGKTTLQEVALGRKFGRGSIHNGGLRRSKAFEKALRAELSILNYTLKSRDACKPYLLKKVNYGPGPIPGPSETY